MLDRGHQDGSEQPPKRKKSFKKRLIKFTCYMAAIAMLLGVVFFGICPFKTIQGHEKAVLETMIGVWGQRTVTDESGEPSYTVTEFGMGTRPFIRMLSNFVIYDMRKQRYLLDDKDELAKSDPAALKDLNGPPQYFQVDRGQTVKTKVKVIWRYAQGRLAVVHAEARNDIRVAEEKILDTPIKRILQNLITTQDALKVYYGEGLVDLQKKFKEEVQNDPAIKRMGLVIDDAVIFTDLDPEYVKQITAKVVAEQKEKAQEQVEKANLAQARAAKAEAEIAKAKVVTEAEAQKQKQILQAEAAAREEVLSAEAKKQQVVLAAEADMEKERMEGEGLKLRKIAEAEGVQALLLAEAVGEEALKLAMYDGEAGLRRQQVEVALNLATALKGMLDGKTILPEGAFVSIGEMSGLKNAVQPVLDVSNSVAGQ